MDMPPIRPKLIRPASGTANDGGSKSNGGYLPRDVSNKQKKYQFKVSDETQMLFGEDVEVEQKTLSNILKEIFLHIYKFIIKFFTPKSKQRSSFKA